VDEETNAGLETFARLKGSRDGIDATEKKVGSPQTDYITRTMRMLRGKEEKGREPKRPARGHELFQGVTQRSTSGRSSDGRFMRLVKLAGRAKAPGQHNFRVAVRVTLGHFLNFLPEPLPPSRSGRIVAANFSLAANALLNGSCTSPAPAMRACSSSRRVRPAIMNASYRSSGGGLRQDAAETAVPASFPVATGIPVSGPCGLCRFRLLQYIRPR